MPLNRLLSTRRICACGRLSGSLRGFNFTLARRLSARVKLLVASLAMSRTRLHGRIDSHEVYAAFLINWRLERRMLIGDSRPTRSRNLLDFCPGASTSKQKPAIEYTSPRMLIQKPATRPGSFLDRQDDSSFNRRRHPIYLTTAGDSKV